MPAIISNPPGRTWFILGGVGSALVVLAHVLAIFIGAPAYRYMGAPDLAPMVERGSWLPALLTGLLVLLFALWAAYAFSGAGWIRRLPLLRLAIALIGIAYTLRGLMLCFELTLLFTGKLPAPRMAAFSAFSLALGLVHLAGLRVCLRSGQQA